MCGKCEGTSAAVTTNYDYILSGLDINFAEDTTRTGFNLDGTYSGEAGGDTCEMQDYFSPASNQLHRYACLASDPNCLGGVDNHLPELVNVFDHTMRVSFRERSHFWIRNGRAVWIVRFSGIDNFWADDTVRVILYRGWAKTTDCDEFLGGSGYVYVDNASLNTSGDLDSPKWFIDGGIVDRMFYASRRYGQGLSTDNPLPLTINLTSSTTVTFDLYQAALYMDMYPIQYSAGAATAMFGGWVNTDTFSLRLEQSFPSMATQIFQMMPHLSDLPSVGGTCDTGSVLAVGGISMGANLTLQPVTISDTRDTPYSSGCGYGW